MSLFDGASAAGAAAESFGDSTGDEARRRAVVALIGRHERALRRTARRYSICVDDADDAYQRALEIVLTKAPTDDLAQLIRWAQTVTKHEALAVRRNRERILGAPPPAAQADRDDSPDWVALIPSQSDGPAERAERREAIARSREALQSLKPQELRALTLLAEGYSYAEIGEITGYSHTKINRCLAEGRERFRRLLSRSEGGERCAELRPLLSAFCDGEAGADEVATLREHLRACAHCRSALRAYRAAPGAAAALAPALPLAHAILGRLHEALGNLISRLQATRAAHAASGLGPGAGGGAAAALGKAAAVCAATAGGAAACVAAGVVAPPAAIEHPTAAAPAIVRDAPQVLRGLPAEPSAGAAAPAANRGRGDHGHERRAGKRREKQPARRQPVPEAEPVEAVEYAPPPAPEPASAPEPPPVPEPAPVESAPVESGGSPAGEFGP